MLVLFGGLAPLIAGCSGDNPYQATASVDSSAPTDNTSAAEVEKNDFLPQGNLNSCIGVAERPDCGSKSKGGWRMNLTFAVLVAGLSFVGWRVVRSVRQRDAVMNDVAPSTKTAVSASDKTTE